MTPAPYDYYDYTKYWRGRDYEHLAEKRAIEKFLAKIPSAQKGSIVDIGGGFGRLASVYAPIFSNCLLVEPSFNLRIDAQKEAKKYENVQVKEGDVAKIPSPDNQFDVALMVRVAHHLPSPKSAFLEASRVLKPHGFFILEYANKLHFRACLRAWQSKNLAFTKNLKPVNQNTEKAMIPFLNHHPKLIEKELAEAGFKILHGLSVSNFRHPLVKKIIPQFFLMAMETVLQRPLYTCYFGPSIFILAQKT
ncbi:MAG: class I SAM-dependent methyltransferase [bacterium]|nr:class I SAM-dependent methyltransferase [bacterium]